MTESQISRASHRLRKRGATIEDLIVKKQPTLEQKKLIQDNVEDSKITTRSLSAIKLSLKLEGLFSKKRKENYQIFSTFLAVAAIDRNKVLKKVCEWYNISYCQSNGVNNNYMLSLKRPRSNRKQPKNHIVVTSIKDERFYLNQIENLLHMDDLNCLQKVNDYDDIMMLDDSTLKSAVKKQVEPYKDLSSFFDDSLYTSLTEYLTYQTRKKKSTKQQNLMLTLSSMLAPIKA